MTLSTMFSAMLSARRTRLDLRVVLAPLLGCLLLHPINGSAVEVCPASGAARYEAGVAAFRVGRLDESYSELRAAHQGCPDNNRYRNDYILAAGASGHSSEALAVAGPLDASSLPTYVLESLGVAARHDHQPDLAIRYYETILAREVDIGARVGRDLALVDRGDKNVARADLRALRETHPDRVDVLEALALTEESLDNNMEALGVTEELLRLDPHHLTGLQLRHRTLTRLGAPHLATELAPKEAIPAPAGDRTRRDELAFEFRWARDDAGTAKTRAQRLDRVIDDVRRTASDPTVDPKVRDGLREDLVAILTERGRLREAATEYEHLITAGKSVGSYTSAAAVTAYEGIRQPRRAVTVFESLPSLDNLPYEAKASYIYALLDIGRYNAAIRRVDGFLGGEPVNRYKNTPELRTENPDYARMIVLAAIVRSYTDRPAEGQKRLEAILEKAPADIDARLALAETYNMRGWPRKAAGVSDLVRLDDSEATAPLTQLFEDQLAMADWAAARDTLNQLTAALPDDDAGLLRAERDWDIHQMPELSIDGHFGRSHGGPRGVIDSEVGEYLYSPPIDLDFRAYAHLDQTVGEPAQGTTFRNAFGAGVEYHTPLWLATGELLEIDHHGPFPQTSVTFTPDDHWKLGATYQARTLETPIAAVVVGVHANRVMLSTSYRTSESTEVGTQITREQFSDSNLRTEWSGYWRERWITGPVYKLDTRVDLDTSRNNLDNTNYFNPRQDFSSAVTLENQWLQFRRDRSALTHELDIGLGSYSQKYHGTGPVGLIQYLLVYDANDRLTLKAGGGTSLRPYDGQRETLNTLIFNVEGRF